MNYFLLSIAVLMASPLQDDVVTRVFINDGSELLAEVLAIENSIAQVRNRNETKSIPVESINVIQFTGQPLDPSAKMRLRLVDGSIVFASELTVNEESFAEIVEHESSEQLIQTRNIDSIVMVPASQELSSQWYDLLQSTDRTADWLIFEREGVLDYIEGTAGIVSAESISFSTDGRTASAPRSRVTGMAYFHAAGRSFVQPIALLTTAGGSQLYLRSLRKGNPDRQESSRLFIMQTVCGAEFRLMPHEIINIDFGAVRFQYLSEIVPSTIEWNPIFVNESIYEYQAKLNGPRFDTSYSNQPLKLNFAEPGTRGDPVERIQYEHGIAMKGGTRLVFRLSGQFSRLQGLCGFSPDAPQDGLVEMVVLGDGKDLYRRVLDNRTDPPQNVDVNIQGINRLTLQVNYHDGRNIGDVIHFCDVKVSR